MSGIYIHIPFCKQACHYCDFHFSTSMKKKEEMVLAIAKEIQMRKSEFENDPSESEQAKQIVETIYFGGGTPSVLTSGEIEFLIAAVYSNYKVSENPEITLEANPDDLSSERIIELSKSPINRLSIGIQSFFEEDLQLMNRAHNSAEAQKCLEEATKYFDNISIDLIYGIPGMSNEKWKQNIETALSFGIPHISSYALTVEPKTTLNKLIQTGKIAAPKDEVAQEHFAVLVETLQANDFIHYELSNFGKANYFSKNNSAYWLGKKYIGIGPSAHSYNGISRSWNVSNNSIYLKSIQENKLPNEIEILSTADRYNEYVMTGLRTIWGVSLDRIETEFGSEYLEYLNKQAQKFLDDDLVYIENNILKPTKKGKFLTDGIASDLFYLNLE
ncbi:radical SAM family heme chaperone HemW [Flavobacterium gawalongense]|uniref:Heme chaperone HemW n=1 Tax=Flavobacterium gawalongense TaxID=2594432 RepID=A0A553BGZ8_9FLAO|nr:radical SAM family heme chaperone HemW [Flavobacterium gawalongense]TRX00589.1 radical SAM family heme chaperone HemW [Flavobacterium gawalongense]TRX04699.1 radical SAM family heme chaperone HemW [Flavobacterium gawalongense]TRX07531.1 radical SAM family heme chaperone HemW [Flavobacterium gawalongense]TRX12970.1 radical SAM family heme chaperone HemW [Flavobacterium gawalongense]TRX31062.1 radical SAM family heme chaperone HemW [Flavobacterium gawalongense]